MKNSMGLLRSLVETPSQVAVNDLSQVLRVLSDWLTKHNVSHIAIGPGKKNAIVINPPNDEHDDVLVLNACLDTAPVGDVSQWHQAPFGAMEVNGWLYGRGSADSKAAVAIFSEIARTQALLSSKRFQGKVRRVTIVFDCDEHSGRFGGIKSYTSRFGFPKFCAIGYPGLDKIVSGSRGFYRTIVTLRGTLAHAGSGTIPDELATAKLQRFLGELDALSHRSKPQNCEFPLGPRASCTWIRTGVRSFSVTPSKIECGVDIRLTPDFDPNAASNFLETVLTNIARDFGEEHSSILSLPTCWPAYRTPNSTLLPQLVQSAATDILGRTPDFVVSGPSNIGNFLAMHGTEVLSGFGVDYQRIHGPDECIRVSSVSDVFRIYSLAVKNYVDGYEPNSAG